jgi:hypothetical protein
MKPESKIEVKKKPYQAMKLTVYGDLRDLTAGKGGNMSDSLGGITML